MPPRFHKIDQAKAFMDALFDDPSADPVSFGSVPETILIPTGEGLVEQINPEWHDARYEVGVCVNYPESSKVIPVK